jgi:hypothetical protein
MNRAVVQRKTPSGAPNFPVTRPVVPTAFSSEPLTRRPLAAPPVYRPHEQSVAQLKPASAAAARPSPPLPYRPQAAPGVQRLGPLQQRPASAIQRHAAPQSAVARSSVIQCWRCGECGHEIAYSYDHSSWCHLYHHRVYETASDRDSNRNDRRHGETRTRSGSFERQYSSGWDERRHYHENRFSTGYVESQRGYWDSRGVYHSY